MMMAANDLQAPKTLSAQQLVCLHARLFHGFDHLGKGAICVVGNGLIFFEATQQTRFPSVGGLVF